MPNVFAQGKVIACVSPWRGLVPYRGDNLRKVLLDNDIAL